MKRLCTALATLLLVSCQLCPAQDLNVREFRRVVDPRNVTTTDRLVWYAGESIQYDVLSRRGSAVVEIPDGCVPVWQVLDAATNAYLVQEGTVASATNGETSFFVIAPLANLPPGKYTSWATIYQGTNRVGVLDRATVEVRWRPGDDFEAAAPLTNVLDQVIGLMASKLDAATAASTYQPIGDYAVRDDVVLGFNGRLGEVVPAPGDYTAEMVGALPLSAGSENPITGELIVSNKIVGEKMNIGRGPFLDALPTHLPVDVGLQINDKAILIEEKGPVETGHISLGYSMRHAGRAILWLNSYADAIGEQAACIYFGTGTNMGVNDIKWALCSRYAERAGGHDASNRFTIIQGPMISAGDNIYPRLSIMPDYGVLIGSMLPLDSTPVYRVTLQVEDPLSSAAILYVKAAETAATMKESQIWMGSGGSRMQMGYREGDHNFYLHRSDINKVLFRTLDSGALRLDENGYGTSFGGHTIVSNNGDNAKLTIKANTSPTAGKEASLNFETGPDAVRLYFGGGNTNFGIYKGATGLGYTVLRVRETGAMAIDETGKGTTFGGQTVVSNYGDNAKLTIKANDVPSAAKEAGLNMEAGTSWARLYFRGSDTNLGLYKSDPGITILRSPADGSVSIDETGRGAKFGGNITLAPQPGQFGISRPIIFTGNFQAGAPFYGTNYLYAFHRMDEEEPILKFGRTMAANPIEARDGLYTMATRSWVTQTWSPTNKAVKSESVTTITSLTAAAYAALPSTNATTLYVILP